MYTTWDVTTPSVDGVATFTRAAEVGRAHHVTLFHLTEPQPVGLCRLTIERPGRAHSPFTLVKARPSCECGWVTYPKGWPRPRYVHVDNRPPNTGFNGVEGELVTFIVEALEEPGAEFSLRVVGWTD